jgi:hypothetical protein
MKLRIFYSWQSDTNEACNRYFARQAIELACEQLEHDLEVDDATRGTPGTPSIAKSIFPKIETSALLIADVSLVEKYTDRKHTINPNVLVEYGFALKALGEERIICFMNLAHGTADDLPFDLRTRAVMVQYTLSPGADAASLQAEMDDLAEQFQREIGRVLNEALFTGLSQASVRAVELFVTSSELGAFEQPSFALTELCTRLDIDERTGRQVVDELEAGGFATHTPMPGGQIRDLRPTDRMFWTFDSVFMSWNPEVDARVIAQKLVDGPYRQLRTETLAEELGWEARRTNPAVTYLVAEGIVDCSRERRNPYVVFSILETPRTRLYVRNR